MIDPQANPSEIPGFAALLELTQTRNFLGVLALWNRMPLVDRQAELPSRLAAAAEAQLGNLPAAAAVLRRVVASTDVEGPTLALAGRVFFDAGDHSASLATWQRAMAMQPQNLVWWLWFARAALEAGQPELALLGAEVFTFHREGNEEASLVYAALLTKSQRADDALIAMERTLARWPNHGIAGPAYAEFVMREFPLQARDCLARNPWRPSASALTPERVRASLWMPAFFATEASAAQWRADLLGEIAQLSVLATSASDPPTGLRERASCLTSTPFFAAFHDADVTPIQLAWGNFVEALAAPLRRGRLTPNQTMPSKPRRIGIVSNRLTDSSAGRFFNSWIPELLASGFTVALYALGTTDRETDRLSGMTTLYRFPRDDVRHWESVRDQIERDKNDVLLFPEPQGSPLTILIAGLRLAPIQCSAFGNPLTTGLSTMDYFLAPDTSEVAQPAAHYRERVIRLRGIGTVIAPAPKPSALDRAMFRFDADEHIYIVNQQLQKWTPQFLEAVAEILQRDPKGRLVYFAFGAHVSVRAFQSMLRDRLNAKRLDSAKRVLCVGRLERDDYLALNQAADVSLDTFGYSGGSSTVDAMSVGLPVVTREGHYLRSRQSAGMLREAGQSYLVCADTETFIDRAIDVASSGLRIKHGLAVQNTRADGADAEGRHSLDRVSPFTTFASVSEFLLSL